VPLDELNLYRSPAIPPKHDYGIGIIGAGAIVRFAHLPAYRKAGFRVVGIHDQSPEAAAAAAAEFDVPTVYRSVDALLDDSRVEIVDIAVPAPFQPEIAQRVIASGRALLCQKPLAETYALAEEIVVAAEAAGVKIAVNQQMRWAPSIATSRAFIERGFLGEPLVSTIDVSILLGWDAWPWLVVSDRLDLMYHSIHYQDATRFLFGMPDRIFTSGGKFPGQPEKAETRTHTIFEYDSGLTAMVRSNNWNWTGDQHAIFRFEGSEGRIEGTIGLLYDYPHGRPDTIRYMSKRLRPDYWFDVVVDDLWIPDAFVGPMASLMEAMQTDGVPATAARDNLDTLRTLFAAYRSMETHRVVTPDEIG
jgi:predicted dehydrogenase